MSERKQEQKVKELSVGEDCFTIELLNGLCLSGPLRTRPIYRDPVPQTDTRSMQSADYGQPLAAT
jgi:hypothetical protein